MNYPDDWLCDQCERPFSKHVKIGDPDENAGGVSPATTNWCYSFKEITNNNEIEDRGGWSFRPTDNLTLIEMMVKQRGIIKEIPQVEDI